MKLRFVKCNPTENMTILVFDPVNPSDYAAVANRIMRENHLHSEQVGYVALPSDRRRDYDAELHMMGGEFCVNATRSLAAALVEKGVPARRSVHGSQGYRLAVSGVEELVGCRVQPTAEDGVYRSGAWLPLPEQVETVTLQHREREMTGTLVTFPGIAHLVLQSPVSEPEAIFPVVLDLFKDRHHKALGIMFCDPLAESMKPLVWVRATDTLIWERGCGSGTAAVGVALASEGAQSVRRTILQPGGVLEVSVEWQGGVKSILLDGDVAIVAMGTLLLPD